jgi:hypothetical protein
MPGVLAQLVDLNVLFGIQQVDEILGMGSHPASYRLRVPDDRSREKQEYTATAADPPWCKQSWKCTHRSSS